MNLASKFVTIVLIFSTIHGTCRSSTKPQFSEGIENCKLANRGIVTSDCWEKYLISESKTNTDPTDRCQASLSLAEFYEAQLRNGEAEKIYSDLLSDNPAPDCTKWAKTNYKAFNEVRIGKQMPNFRAKDSKGRIIETTSLRGRFVVLFFWSSWCGACKRVYEDLKTLQNTYKQPLTILGISGDLDKSDFENTIISNKLNWQNIMDGNDFLGPISSLYSIHGYPSIFVIDPKGAIISHNTQILYDKKQM